MLSSRHITTACFFAVIYYLLIINGKRAANMNYDAIEEGLVTAVKRDRENIDRMITAFRQEAKQPGAKERVTPYLEKAEKIHAHTDSLFNWMGQLKSEIKGAKIHNGSIADVLGAKKLSNLKSSLDKQLTTMISMIGYDASRENFIKHASINWRDSILFNKTKAEAANAVISLLQHDMYRNEYMLIMDLYSQAGDNQIGPCMNDFAVAVPLTPYVLPGQKVEAIISFMSHLYRHKVSYTVNSGKIVKTQNRVASWEGKAINMGLNTISGLAKATPNRDEETVIRPYSFQYFVTAQGIAVHIDKANTCYIGIDNPITISVPGFPSDKLSLKVKGATVTSTAPGKFNIVFKQNPKEHVYAFVEGTNDEGTTSTLASLPLKVMNLPTPRAEVAGVSNGDIPLRKFRKEEGLVAVLRDCDFDMEYTIVSYKLSLLHNHNSVYIQPVTGKGDFRNNPKVMKIMETVRKGDKAIFEEIIARDENGRTVELTPMILKLY